MEKRVLITGGAGFLGANLCRKLLANGDLVTCLDNFSSGRKSNIETLLSNPNFNVIQKDVTDQDLKYFFNLFDEIYHLACPASPPKYQEDPVKTMMTNVVGTHNVLTAAANTDWPIKVLLASTSEIYGDPLEHPQKESYRGNVDSTNIRACYDEGKRAAESLMYDFNRMHDVDIRVVRIFNTYGPFMDPQDGRVVTNFISQGLNNEPFTLFGEGQQTRSFCFVDDLIDGMVAVMASNTTEPVNVGNPHEITIRELADTLHKALALSGDPRYTYEQMPLGDPKRRLPAIERAMSLGWAPKVSLKEGLQKTIEYFKGEINAVESDSE